MKASLSSFLQQMYISNDCRELALAVSLRKTLVGMFRECQVSFEVEQLELFHSSRKVPSVESPIPVVAVAKVTKQGFTNRTEIKLCCLIDFLQPGACIIKRSGLQKLVLEISK